MLDLSIRDTVWGPKNYHSLCWLLDSPTCNQLVCYSNMGELCSCIIIAAFKTILHSLSVFLQVRVMPQCTLIQSNLQTKDTLGTVNINSAVLSLNSYRGYPLLRGSRHLRQKLSNSSYHLSFLLGSTTPINFNLLS